MYLYSALGNCKKEHWKYYLELGQNNRTDKEGKPMKNQYGLMSVHNSIHFGGKDIKYRLQNIMQR